MSSQAPPLIAHVVYRFGVGGLENGIVNLINGMPRGRWRHAIVALTDICEDFTKRIDRDDVTYVGLEKKPGHLVRDYPQLFRMFKKLGPTIVHTRNLAALEAVVPAWAAGVPVRVHGEHGWDIHDPQGDKRRYRIMRRVYRPFVTRYVALSRHLEDYLVRQVRLDPLVISQIHNGVDTQRFHPAHGVRPAIAGCPFGAAGEWLIGSVGRMEHVKDPLNLVHAFVRALQIEPSAAKSMRLILVGEGTLRDEASAVLARAGMSDRAWFAGERADVSDVMRGLDCFVSPSLAEGVSNTILEAMATGLPVVATRVGGNTELIESGMTGTLVPSASPETLARSVLDYFTDRGVARRHGKAARRDAENRFSLTTMVSDYTRVYERTLAAAGIRVPPTEGEPADASLGPVRGGVVPNR